MSVRSRPAAYDEPVSTPAPRHPLGSTAGRAARRVVTLAVALLLAVATAGCSIRFGETATAPSRSAPPSASTAAAPAPDPAIEREQAVATLLAQRAHAITSHNRAAFAAGLASSDSAFGKRQLAVFERLSTLPLRSFAYGTPAPAPALSAERVTELGGEAFVARVRVSYALTGFDRAPREFETYLTAVRSGPGSRWRLADDTDGGGQPQPWDLPGMTAQRGARTLVLGNAPRADLVEYARLGDAAVARVSGVWSHGFAGRLVIVAPASTAEMGQQLGQDAAGLDQVAAVTDGPLDLGGTAQADRIVINPAAFARLEETGRRVVITHETTHVAIRATTDRPVPMWLSEGMADYVGYGGLGLSRTTVAAALLTQVRAGKGPRALPAEADFDPARTTIAPSYNAAYLAVNLLADEHGQPALVRFYLAAATRPAGTLSSGDADQNTETAFRAVLATTAADFTATWLAYLGRLATPGR